MERIETVENLSKDEIEAIFRERAAAAIGEMKIRPFASTGLELARSEKELAKCAKLAEKAKHKSELRKRDAELRESAGEKAHKELTAEERRRKNKKTTRTPSVAGNRSRATHSGPKVNRGRAVSVGVKGQSRQPKKH